MSKYEQIVNFTVGEVDYGVPVSQVREVRDCQEVTPVTGTPHWVDGVTNLRDQIIIIVDIRKRLDLADDEGGRNKIIVIESHKSTVGVVVDTVTEVSDIDEEDISRNLMFSKDQSYIKGIGKQDDKLVVILDLELIVDGVHEVMDISPFLDQMAEQVTAS
ncbi:MAG: chemotaxis protein CheW [Candidatus Bathyarchaeota archaeon]|nr:chemotaxis protein CheW [Candidatus Bathyarchaeota archaeon]